MRLLSKYIRGQGCATRRSRVRKTLNRHNFRRASLEALEDRRLLAADWQNPLRPTDVDGNGLITPNDALQVINELNSKSITSGGLFPVPGVSAPPPYLDTNGDSLLSPNDALRVINRLNSLYIAPTVETVELHHDSAPFGQTNDDLRTKSAILVGRVDDLDDAIDSIQFQLDTSDFQPIFMHGKRAFTIDLGLASDGSDD